VTKKVSRSSSLSIARAREVAAAFTTAFTTLVVLTPAREERSRPTDARRD
jgi:hypothetical protein